MLKCLQAHDSSVNLLSVKKHSVYHVCCEKVTRHVLAQICGKFEKLQAPLNIAPIDLFSANFCDHKITKWRKWKMAMDNGSIF